MTTQINMTQELTDLIVQYSALHEVKKSLYEIENMQTASSVLNVQDAIYEVHEEIDRIDLLPILKIGMETGTAWLNVFYSLGSTNDDLMSIIDAYAQEKDTALRLYEASEVLSYDDDYIDENFLPINGGACYTDMISTCEEMTVYDLIYTVLEMTF
jgi:hypothetical protein